MKMALRILFLSALTLIAVGSAQAGLYVEDFSSGGSVGTISGTFPVVTPFTGNVNNANAEEIVSGLTITLTVSFTSGDYGNGSLYASLTSPNGTLVTLIRKPVGRAKCMESEAAPAIHLAIAARD